MQQGRLKFALPSLEHDWVRRYRVQTKLILKCSDGKDATLYEGNQWVTSIDDPHDATERTKVHYPFGLRRPYHDDDDDDDDDRYQRTVISFDGPMVPTPAFRACGRFEKVFFFMDEYNSPHVSKHFLHYLCLGTETSRDAGPGVEIKEIWLDLEVRLFDAMTKKTTTLLVGSSKVDRNYPLYTLHTRMFLEEVSLVPDADQPEIQESYSMVCLDAYSKGLRTGPTL